MSQPARISVVFLVLLIASCVDDGTTADDVPTENESPVSCNMHVAQTGDGASVCAITLTVDVKCDGNEAVGSAALTAQTDPSLDTGVQSKTVTVSCNKTTRITFGGMPCAEAADGAATLDNGVQCAGVGIGLY